MQLWVTFGIGGLLLGTILVLCMFLFQKQRYCPKCNNPFPKLRKPKTTTQIEEGVFICSKCGCKANYWGKEITNPQEYKKKVSRRIRIAYITSGSIMIIIVLGTLLAMNLMFKQYETAQDHNQPFMKAPDCTKQGGMIMHEGETCDGEFIGYIEREFCHCYCCK